MALRKKTAGRWLATGLPAILLAIVLSSREAAARECVLDRTQADFVAVTRATLEAIFGKCEKPVETWFEFDTSPTLGNARRIEGRVYYYREAERDGYIYGQLSGLTAETTYHFRGWARLPDGRVVGGGVTEFRTFNSSQVTAPTCRYEHQGRRTFKGRDSLEVNFLCNSHYFMGDVHYFVSTDPGMADAKEVSAQVFFGKGLPFDLQFSVLLAYDDYPDGAVLYVQARVENNAGTGRSTIVPVTMKRPQEK